MTTPSTAAPVLYFLAGEVSGDTHGAGLLRALRERAPDAVFLGRGGPRMKALAPDPGFEDWCDQAAVLGLWEVLKKYGWFRAQFRRVLDGIAARRPDAVVLIDYPGFNLRLAKALRRAGYRGRLVYYISPQVWAWHRARIPQMARLLDLMICIFPFEQPLFARAGLRTVFGGHPLLEQLGAARMADAQRDPNLVGLFPGSRAREIRKIFPVLLKTAERLRAARPALRFAVAAATPALAAQLLALRTEFLPQWQDQDCAILAGAAHRLMQTAAVGLVASGTATVEAAFFGLPLAIVYRVAPLTYWVGRAVVRVPFLGMINLLAGKEIAREFLQHRARPELLVTEVLRLLDEPEARSIQAREFAAVVEKLSGDAESGGAKISSAAGASVNAAEAILTTLRTSGTFNSAVS
jgi:lipid-A-disaccharide synthase